MMGQSSLSHRLRYKQQSNEGKFAVYDCCVGDWRPSSIYINQPDYFSAASVNCTCHSSLSARFSGNLFLVAGSLPRRDAVLSGRDSSRVDDVASTVVGWCCCAFVMLLSCCCRWLFGFLACVIALLGLASWSSTVCPRVHVFYFRNKIIGRCVRDESKRKEQEECE
jgi:hypothetical protein